MAVVYLLGDADAYFYVIGVMGLHEQKVFIMLKPSILSAVSKPRFQPNREIRGLTGG
jgi:hypothetical protein